MNRNLIIIGIAITAIIATISGTIAIWSITRYNRVIVSPQAQKTQDVHPDATPTPTPDPLRDRGVLLMGYGGGTHDGGYLTDTILLAYIQPKQSKISIISIPRDTWIELPLLTDDAKVGYKVNAAYAMGRDQHQYLDRPIQFQGDAGGGQLAEYAVSEITGLPVEHFMAVSFAGFTKGIDRLGGITVNVPHTFDDYYYPIEEKKNDLCDFTQEQIDEMAATMSAELLEKELPCRYEHIHYNAGVQSMDGTSALKYVRSRKSETYGGDYYRSQRQMSVIQALKDELADNKNPLQLWGFIDALTFNLQTDINLSTATQWLQTFPEVDQFKLQTIRITEDNVLQADRSPDGQYILTPKSGNDYTLIHQYIQNELAGITPTPTPAPTSQPTPLE